MNEKSRIPKEGTVEKKDFARIRLSKGSVLVHRFNFSLSFFPPLLLFPCCRLKHDLIIPINEKYALRESIS